MADREDMVSLPREAKRHRAAEPAQAASDDCDVLFHGGFRQLELDTPKGKMPRHKATNVNRNYFCVRPVIAPSFFRRTR